MLLIYRQLREQYCYHNILKFAQKRGWRVEDNYLDERIRDYVENLSDNQVRQNNFDQKFNEIRDNMLPNPKGELTLSLNKK